MVKETLNLKKLDSNKAFRTYNKDGCTVEFYNIEEHLENRELSMLPFRFVFVEKNTKLKIIVEKDYYDISTEFFADKMLPEIFNLWLTAQRTNRIKKIFTALQVVTLLIVGSFIFMFDSFIFEVLSWTAIGIYVISLIITRLVRVKYKKAQRSTLETLGHDENDKLEKRLREYYEKRRKANIS